MAILLGLAAFSPSPSAAQSRAPAAVEISAGTHLENYLRLLQISGRSGSYPWSIRGFSRRELGKLLPADSLALPWRLTADRLNARFSVAPVTLSSAMNTAFPYGGNDGAVWAGRGLTVSGTASVTVRAGPVTLTLSPIAFATTNAAFPLANNGNTGALAYNDGLFPDKVDHPQRFGDGAYGRGDAGASEIRLDTRFLTLGFGTAPMTWGPATEFPFLIGTNAAGFPHAFIGSGEPLPIGIGTIHVRGIWGKLSQSSFSPVVGEARFTSESSPGTERLMTGLIMALSPRLTPGLELGFARFAHLPYLQDGVNADFFRRVWPTFLKKNVSNTFVEAENELASVFARWAFPKAGFELYVEHGHDDWYNDLRDLTQEPEHNRSYMIGFQKVLNVSASRVRSIRGELINYEMPPLGRDRPGQGYIYTHHVLRQGHTHRGQLIGANPGVGAAAASLLTWESYTPAGRSALTWRRIVRAHVGTFSQHGVVEERAADVIHSLGVERSKGNARLRYNLGVELMANLNRNREKDVFNLNLRAGLEWSPGRAGARGN